MKRYKINLPNDSGSKSDQDTMMREFLPTEYWDRLERLEERDKRESGWGNSYESYYDLLNQRYQSDIDRVPEKAFDRIHELWPGLKLEKVTDFGGIFQSETPPPDNLPCWAWVSEVET